MTTACTCLDQHQQHWRQNPCCWLRGRCSWQACCRRRSATCRRRLGSCICSQSWTLLQSRTARGMGRQATVPAHHRVHHNYNHWPWMSTPMSRCWPLWCRPQSLQSLGRYQQWCRRMSGRFPSAAGNRQNQGSLDRPLKLLLLLLRRGQPQASS